jgi:Fe/S biogenesis protein NfuA
MVEVTETARERILGALRAANPPREHLRIEAAVTGGQFDYRMSGLRPDEVKPDDTVVDSGEFRLVLDPETAERMEGATIDFRETLIESGFRIDNPNEPPGPTFGDGPREDLTGSVPDRVQTLLDREINPAIAAHGGSVTLVDYRDDRIYLAFGGGCQGCGLVDVTLKEGIETRIREAVPEVVEVVDTTDHSTGVNPFY